MLATKLRPIFLTLVPIALQNDMCIAVVTFSGQTSIIREVVCLYHSLMLIPILILTIQLIHTQLIR